MTLPKEVSGVRPSNPEQLFAITVTLVFTSVAAFGTIHHEMWRDELQAWLIAKESRSVLDLFRNLNYDGHPALWHLCLFLLQRVTRSPFWMQALHVTIAATTVFLVARFAPFSRLQRGVFAFGYFPVYEYAVISRSYALGVLLLILACVLFETRRTRFLPLALVLALLAHTTVHGLILSIAMLAALSIERFQLDVIREGDPGGRIRRAERLGWALIVLGIGASIAQLVPPPDTGYAVPWYVTFDIERAWAVLCTLPAVLFPIFEPGLHWWGSNVFYQDPALTYLAVIVSCGVTVGAAAAFRRQPIALGFYLVASLGLLAFFYLKFIGWIRHQGYLFFALFASAWLFRRLAQNVVPTHERDPAELPLGTLLSSVLICQLIGGIEAMALEWRYEFSAARRTAEYLAGSGLGDHLIVADLDNSATGVLGYLDRKAYFPRGDRVGSFVIWDQARLATPSDSEIVAIAAQFATLRRDEVLILLNRPLAAGSYSCSRPDSLASFTGAAVPDEEFHVYVLNRRKAPKARTTQSDSGERPSSKDSVGLCS